MQQTHNFLWNLQPKSNRKKESKKRRKKNKRNEEEITENKALFCTFCKS